MNEDESPKESSIKKIDEMKDARKKNGNEEQKKKQNS